MRGLSVKPRFFVFLTLLLVLIAFLVSKLSTSAPSYKADRVYASESSVSQEVDCIIIRNESLTLSPSTVRTEYIAAENALVSEGDEICYLYTTGYTQSLLEKLETARENIQSYHRELLGTIVDNNLDRLDEIVRITSDQFRALAVQETSGNLRFVVKQLKTAMSNRQEYLRQNKRDDTKLTKLYDDENTRKTSIQSWQTIATADRDGVVSFYIDGYENDLSADTLSPADAEAVLRGEPLAQTAVCRKDGVYRVVDQNEWHVAIINRDKGWSPAVGQIYHLTFEGYGDLSFSATVENVQKNADTLLSTLRVEQPIGPLIYERTGRVTLTNTINSLAVKSSAVATVNGQTGVWLNDVEGGTFVRVNVLSSDNGYTQIEPLVSGSLSENDTILLK